MLFALQEKASGEGVRLTKMEVARVLRERNEYKEKYLSLLEQIRCCKQSLGYIVYSSCSAKPAQHECCKHECYVHACMYMYSVCIQLYVYMYMYLYSYMCTCTCIYTAVCVHVHVLIQLYVYMNNAM